MPPPCRRVAIQVRAGPPGAVPRTITLQRRSRCFHSLTNKGARFAHGAQTFVYDAVGVPNVIVRALDNPHRVATTCKTKHRSRFSAAPRRERAR